MIRLPPEAVAFLRRGWRQRGFGYQKAARLSVIIHEQFGLSLKPRTLARVLEREGLRRLGSFKDRFRNRDTIHLDDNTWLRFSELRRKATCPKHLRVRLGVILESAKGTPINRIARDLLVSRPTVRKWRNIFRSGGAEAIASAPLRARSKKPKPTAGRPINARQLLWKLTDDPSVGIRPKAPLHHRLRIAHALFSSEGYFRADSRTHLKVGHLDISASAAFCEVSVRTLQREIAADRLVRAKCGFDPYNLFVWWMRHVIGFGIASEMVRQGSPIARRWFKSGPSSRCLRRIERLAGLAK